MRAAPIQITVPARGQNPSGVHREAAPIAGRWGPHLCPAPGGQQGCEGLRGGWAQGTGGGDLPGIGLTVGWGRGRAEGGTGSGPSPEVVATLWAVELCQAPHLVVRHWFITLPTLATP